MATEFGLGLLLGWLVTPKGRVIGEIRVPPIEIPKVEIRSLRIGNPAIAVEEKETNSMEYQEICKIDVPEGYYLSLEEISLLPQVNADYARFQLEIGDLKKDDIKLPTNLDLPFRGRVTIPAGQRVYIGIKTIDEAQTVKGNGAIIGVLVGVV